LGNSSAGGASFSESGSIPVHGVITLQIDPTKGLAKVLSVIPYTRSVSGALDVANRLGIQNTISATVPVTFENMGNPKFEGWRDPEGRVIKNPVTAIAERARAKVKNRALLNHGDRRVAQYNAELQFALGANPFDVARVSVNPADGKRHNFGSETLAVANQLYEVLVAYGGVKAGERIPTCADFNSRVNKTINRLYDQGRAAEIDVFLRKLANPYGVNAGNSYVAQANAALRGSTKIDPTVAAEVRRAFEGSNQRKKSP
jgi:hypothetical protein